MIAVIAVSSLVFFAYHVERLECWVLVVAMVMSVLERLYRRMRGTDGVGSAAIRCCGTPWSAGRAAATVRT